MSGQDQDAPRWSARVPLAVGFVALALLVGVLGVWSVTTRIAGAVIASGMIQVESNRQVIQHQRGGIVGEILAKDGDRVQAGDVVLRLDDTLLRSELAIIERQLAEILARKIRLAAERDGAARLTVPTNPAMDFPDLQDMIAGQERLFEARLESLQQEDDQLAEQIAQARDQITGTQAQLTALHAQLDLMAAEIVDARALLDKGLTQSQRVSALEREQAGLRGRIGALDAQVAQIRGQIAALDIQRIKLRTARREGAITEIRDLQYQEIELEQRRIATLENLSRMDITSPASGVIYDSKIFALRAVISPAEPIMYVIPQDQPLVVTARIEAIHIDQVHIGQEVSLRFPAFDQRRTPEILGQVAKISADVFTDETTGQSFYSAELVPRAGELAKIGTQELLPGMPVEAFLKTTERSPLSYLTKPLTDYFTKAFR